MSVNDPAPILISRAPASKQLVALSKLHRFRNVSFAVDPLIGIGGVTSTWSATTAPSNPNAEFGAVSKLAIWVTHAAPVPETTAEVHPEGSAGAVTPSKFSLNPAGTHWSPTVQALPSSHVFVLFVNTHRPVAGLQASLVQTLPSLQTRGFAPTQIAFWQVSGLVQALPSLQAVASGAGGFEQSPVPVLQVPATWH